MPIHDLGYRPWQGRLSPQVLRWWVIAQTAARLAWRGRWLRRLLYVVWIPTAYMGVMFFFYEQSVVNPMTQAVAVEFLRNLDVDVPRDLDVAGSRHLVWAALLMTFFRYPQAFLMLLVIGLIAPPLIAQDVRSRAFLLYFSRPITRMGYLVGKLSAVWFYVLMLTTAPALALYVFAVLLSPDISVVGHTWDIPLRILGASAVLMIPTTTLALAFSSLTAESRYAGFAWFGIWVAGWVAYGCLFVGGIPGVEVDPRWGLVSLYHTLGEVQKWVFGFGGESTVLVPSVILLSTVSVVSLAVLFRRISSPMRI